MASKKYNGRGPGGSSRPSGRIGRGGVGPPAGNVAGNRNRGGTSHRPGTSTNGCAVLALAMVAVPVGVVVALVEGVRAVLG